jgi:hypothetical protein
MTSSLSRRVSQVVEELAEVLEWHSDGTFTERLSFFKEKNDPTQSVLTTYRKRAVVEILAGQPHIWLVKRIRCNPRQARACWEMGHYFAAVARWSQRTSFVLCDPPLVFLV